MRSTARVILVLLAAALCGGASDVKYTLDMQMMQGMPPMSSTVYVKGGLERRDMNMPMGMGTITTITQCGEKKTIVYNPKCKVYFEGGLDERTPGMSMGQQRGAAGPAKAGGIVKIDTTFTDTGEKQTIAGLPARHITVKTTMDPQPGACMQGRGDMSMDMWMANLPGSATCKRELERMPAQMVESGGNCRDKFEFNVHGSGGGAAGMAQPGGLIVKGTMTVSGVNPQHRGAGMTMTMTSRDISTADLDPSVFQVPAGFKAASSMQEVYQCGMSIGGMMSAMRQAGQQQAAQAQAQQHAAPAEGAAGEAANSKPAGITRIGMVTADKSGKVDVSAFSTLLAQKIDAHHGFDAVRLDATEPDAAQKECVEKKCDFILYSDVQEAKTGMPKLGGLLRGAARMGGGSVAPTQSLKMDYRLTFASDNQQVAKDTLSNSQQAMDVMAATAGLVDKTADRATTDASKAHR